MATRPPVEEELIGRMEWLIKLRWLAAGGVIVVTGFVNFVLGIPLPTKPLYFIGLLGFAYNAALHFRRQYLERMATRQAVAFDTFAKIQTGLDWAAMILLVHFSGGIESPAIFYFIFHITIAALLLSPRACYFYATLAAVLVGGLAGLEYAGIVPHVAIPGFLPGMPYQNPLFILGVLFFFVSTLYISAYLSTSVTANLRRKDEELLALQRDLAEAYGRMQTLYQVAQTVGSTLKLEEVLTLIARSAAETMGVRASSIRLLDENTYQMTFAAAYGLSQDYIEKGPVDARQSPIYRETLAGRPVIISDAWTDPRVQYPEETKRENIHSALCVPLTVKERTIGALMVYSEEIDRFHEDDAEFLAALAAEGAIAIENAQAYQALEAMDRAKSEFVLLVTHELRAPLAAVQSMLRVIEGQYVGPLGPKQAELIQRAERRITSLLTLVSDLLALAAGRAERFRWEKKDVLLNQVLGKVVDLISTKAADKGVSLTVDIPDEPLTLLANEDGMERVFMNLLSNAVKYTLSGGSVTARLAADGDQITFEVTDTGIGIPADALPRLFDEFYRAPNAKEIEKEGTGLGLAIVKGVIEQHGGTITVDSTLGKGSTFRVVLPSTSQKS